MLIRVTPVHLVSLLFFMLKKVIAFFNLKNYHCVGVSFLLNFFVLNSGFDSCIHRWIMSLCLKACCVFLHSIALYTSEWQMIQKLFVVDHVIKITRTEGGDASPSETQYISEPSKCSNCSWFMKLVLQF